MSQNYPLSLHKGVNQAYCKEASPRSARELRLWLGPQAKLQPVLILRKQVGKEHGTWGQRARPSVQELAKVFATQGREGGKASYYPKHTCPAMPGLYPEQPCPFGKPTIFSTDAQPTSGAGISHPTGWAKAVGKESQLHMPFLTFLRGTTAGSEQERDRQAQGSSTEKAELPDARGKVRSDPACRR